MVTIHQNHVELVWMFSQVVGNGKSGVSIQVYYVAGVPHLLEHHINVVVGQVAMTTLTFPDVTKEKKLY